MKKILIVAALIGVAGCQPSASSTAQPVGDSALPMLIWTDPLTGCDYIAPTGFASYGAQPRLSSDGFHAYCADQKAGRVVIMQKEPAQ